MKKILCCLLILCLFACDSKENEKMVFAPSSSELGSVCTIVSKFDQDIYNISFFYTENENYPILNKDDFNYINQIGLKYSDEGSKDVSKYKINQDNAYKLCNIENANVVNVAIQISDTNILKFMSELRNYEIHYEVEKEEQLFEVKMSNNIISTTELEINYTRVYSQKMGEEAKALSHVNLDERYNISLDENHPIIVNTFVGDLIHEDGSQSYNPTMKTVGLGEAYQILMTVAPDESIAASYVPILTLVKFSKNDVNESTYVQFDGQHYMTSELNDYILYETEDSIIYDLNKYIYGFNIVELIDENTTIEAVEVATYEISMDILNQDLIETIYSKIIDKVKEVIK